MLKNSLQYNLYTILHKPSKYSRYLTTKRSVRGFANLSSTNLISVHSACDLNS